jgi:predicted PurR-regulated permease PerM
VQTRQAPDAFHWFIRVATIALVVGILRFAQDVLLPIAFAALLAFLLSPLVVRLTRWGLPKAAAIILTVTLAFSVIGTIGWVVATQAITLVRELPNYEQNLHHKITALKKPNGHAVFTRVAGMVDTLERDLRVTPPEHAHAAPPSTAEPKPVPVEVKATDPSPWQVARDLATPILRPIGIAGIVIVFFVAMLFQREDLRDRVMNLVSAGQLNMATQAFDDAATRVSRYLGMLLIVNATYGIPIGIGLYFIGIPNALLWGLLATLLRFIPFLGPWIAAAFPVTLAFAVDPGWAKLLWVLGLFVTMEIISNNIVEVIVYGATTGISNLALLVAAVFWTWLWGPAGLVLSTRSRSVSSCSANTSPASISCACCSARSRCWNLRRNSTSGCSRWSPRICSIWRSATSSNTRSRNSTTKCFCPRCCLPRKTATAVRCRNCANASFSRRAAT